jgi:hypothetical protein
VGGGFNILGIILCAGGVVAFAFLIARLIAAILTNAERVHDSDWQAFADSDERTIALSHLIEGFGPVAASDTSTINQPRGD